MKLYIPRLGDDLRLTADWTFPVWCEHRNQTLLDVMGYGYDSVKREVWLKKVQAKGGMFGHEKVPVENFTMPVDTVLRVKRIFIRNGARDYDSVSFTAKVKGKGVRFWAKLDDCNGLEFEPVPHAKP